MFGKLYLITCSVTDKSYVGKTYDSIESRWNQHIRESKRFPHRKFYAAIIKYGPDNFIVEEIASAEENELEILEIKLIQELDTYKNGYNSTLGGDGKRYITISDSAIIDKYHELKSIKDVSRQLKIDEGSIRKILASNSIELYKPLKPNKKTNIYSDTLNMYFGDTEEIAHYLIDNKIANAPYVSVRRSILRVIDGTRKTYLKHRFSIETTP